MKSLWVVLMISAIALDVSPAFAIKQYSSKTGDRTWKGFVTGAPKSQTQSSGAARSAAQAAGLSAGGVPGGRARVPKDSFKMTENPIFKSGVNQSSGGLQRGNQKQSGNVPSRSSDPLIFHRENSKTGAITTHAHFPDGTKARATSYGATKQHSTRVLYPDGTARHERGTKHDDGSSTGFGVTKSPEGRILKYRYETDPQGNRRDHLIRK